MERFIPTCVGQSGALGPWGAWLGGGLALSAVVAFCPAAWANVLSTWQFDPATQQLILTLPAGVVPQSSVAEGGDRIIITLPQTELGTVATEARYDGPVQQIQLSQVADAVQMVLYLATPLASGTDSVQLIAMAAGDQTRWVLTPPVAPVAGLSPAPTAEGMIVELPPLPADPNLNWPYTGVGRLSISAANLMLPSNLDTFNTLPETLAIDPFNLGLANAEPISVPSLEELDAAVGVAITNPTVAVPSMDAPPAPSVATGTAAPASTEVIVLPPPDSTQPSDSVAVAPSSPAPSLDSADIDQESGGLAIPVIPSEESVAGASAPTVSSPPAEPEPAVIPSPSPTVVVVPPTSPQPIPQPSVVPAPDLPSPQVVPPVAAEVPPAQPAQPTAVITQEPGSPQAIPQASPQVVPPAAGMPTNPPFLAMEPPSAAPAVGNPVLAVPTMPNTASTETVVPPTIASEPGTWAEDAALAFGQPLPNGKAVNASPSGDRPLSPDVLIASGTVLELRYTGSQPLTLNPNATLNEVLVLETEIRDPATNGVLAPAGSQLIGQFHTHNDSHQWVSQMLIAPSGHRISFVSTSDYIYGTPQVSGGRLALGAGIGALALTLLTGGVGGLGLLGGALIGTTAVVGTAPQYIVIQPNEVIYAEVMQDIPRSMPIATAPAEVREWGTVPGAW